jgi:hypothetical protein
VAFGGRLLNIESNLFVVMATVTSFHSNKNNEIANKEIQQKT